MKVHKLRNSPSVSQFAVFLIDVRVKSSIASSCSDLFYEYGRRQRRLAFPVNALGTSGNDPSAGSPTETLLRLHLPLNDEV